MRAFLTRIYSSCCTHALNSHLPYYISPRPSAPLCASPRFYALLCASLRFYYALIYICIWCLIMCLILRWIFTTGPETLWLKATYIHL